MGASDRTAIGRARRASFRLNTRQGIRRQTQRLVWAALAVGLSGAAVASAPASQAKATATVPSSAAMTIATVFEVKRSFACMRKLLTILNAMTRTHTTWQQIGQSENARP